MRKYSLYEKIIWIILIVTLLAYFFTEAYVDLLTVMDMTYELTDSIFHGDFINGCNSVEWLYGIGIYLVMVIWSVPVWCVIHIFKLDASIYLYAPISVLWYKVLLLGIAVLGVCALIKVVREILPGLSERGTRCLVFTYLSSLIFVLPTLGISQFDGFEVLFLLIALYYFAKGQDKKFLLFFAVANALKLFTLIIFIPLICFRYKKIYRIIIEIFKGCSLIIVDKIIMYFISTESEIGRTKISDFAKQLLGSRIEIGFEVSVFALIFIFICVFAYLCDYEGNTRRGKVAVWIATLAAADFVIFGQINSYWCLLLTPLITICLFFNVEKVSFSLLLNLIANVCFTVVHCYEMNWVFGGPDTFHQLFLKNVGNQTIKGQNIMHYTFELLLQKNWIVDNLFIIKTIMLSCWISVLLVSCPYLIKVSQGKKQEIMIEKWIPVCSVLAIAVFYIWQVWVLIIL